MNKANDIERLKVELVAAQAAVRSFLKEMKMAGVKVYPASALDSIEAIAMRGEHAELRRVVNASRRRLCEAQGVCMRTRKVAMVEVLASIPKDFTGCVEWNGARRKSGYGRTRFNNTYHFAHRVSYVISNDLSIHDIAGLVIRHRCDNPPCVNPNHLVVGTQADNCRDMHERGRGRIGALPPEINGKGMLTAEAASIIRAQLRSGEGCTKIARDHGVSHSTILDIKHGRTWRTSEAPARSNSTTTKKES